MIKEKLIENAKNPYNIEMKVTEDSYVCTTCSFISEQNMPEQSIDKNCPVSSCNLTPMERAGPYVFITSFEGLRTLQDLNNGGLLEREAVHIDFQPSRVSKYTCLAAYCYDLDLRSMAPLFSAIMTKETEMSVYVILELVRKQMEEKLNATFDPAMYMADEAGCFKNAIVREHGLSKLGSYGTCELHFMKSVFQHCLGGLGIQQKQFQHLKFAEGLLNAATPAIYENLYASYVKWIKERPGRIEILGVWLDWWHARRSGWSNAFRNVQLPRTNLAEVGNSKFSSRSGMTKLSLDMAIKAVISEHQEYSAKKKGVVNGDFVVGQGRSRVNLEEKQIKELFKRIQVTPSDGEEESAIVQTILGDILGDINVYDAMETNAQSQEYRNMVTEIIDGREEALTNSPLNKESTHRPPATKKITPVKKPLPKSGRVRLNLNAQKDSLQCTVTSLPKQLSRDGNNLEKQIPSKAKSVVSQGEKNLRRALNTFCQLIDAEQNETGQFRITIKKPELVFYNVQVLGKFSCNCEDFKRKNKISVIDEILCKHVLYVLLIIGIDPIGQRDILTKCRCSDFSEEDMTELLAKCLIFDFQNVDTNEVFKKLERAVSVKPRKESDLDKKLNLQKPLPYINELRFYGSFNSKNEAMEEILTNEERFVVSWYALLAPNGRRQCPGAGHHEKKCIQRGQMCLAVDFNSILLKNVDGQNIYRIKDQRRFFCLQEVCLRDFVKKELKDFSNIKSPTVVLLDYLSEGSESQLSQRLPPDVETVCSLQFD